MSLFSQRRLLEKISEDFDPTRVSTPTTTPPPKPPTPTKPPAPTTTSTSNGTFGSGIAKTLGNPEIANSVNRFTSKAYKNISAPFTGKSARPASYYARFEDNRLNPTQEEVDRYGSGRRYLEGFGMALAPFGGTAGALAGNALGAYSGLEDLNSDARHASKMLKDFVPQQLGEAVAPPESITHALHTDGNIDYTDPNQQAWMAYKTHSGMFPKADGALGTAAKGLGKVFGLGLPLRRYSGALQGVYNDFYEKPVHALNMGKDVLAGNKTFDQASAEFDLLRQKHLQSEQEASQRSIIDEVGNALNYGNNAKRILNRMAPGYGDMAAIDSGLSAAKMVLPSGFNAIGAIPVGSTMSYLGYGPDNPITPYHESMRGPITTALQESVQSGGLQKYINRELSPYMEDLANARTIEERDAVLANIKKQLERPDYTDDELREMYRQRSDVPDSLEFRQGWELLSKLPEDEQYDVKHLHAGVFRGHHDRGYGNEELKALTEKTRKRLPKGFSIQPTQPQQGQNPAPATSPQGQNPPQPVQQPTTTKEGQYLNTLYNFGKRLAIANISM